MSRSLYLRSSASVKNDHKVNCEGHATFEGGLGLECMRRMESTRYGVVDLRIAILGFDTAGSRSDRGLNRESAWKSTIELKKLE